MSSQVTAREFDFSPLVILNEAWGRINGAKGPLVFAALIIVISNPIITLSLAKIGAPQGIGVIVNIVLSSLLYAGLFRMSLNWVSGKRISTADVFFYFNGKGPTLSFVVAQIAMMIAIGIGAMLLVLPGIYLASTYWLTFPLIIDRNLSFWEAMETSRKTLTTNFSGAFVFVLFSIIIWIVAAIPFGIGLIWAMPLLIVAVGIVYDKAFGITTSA